MKRILITAGPTREPIDDVRYISNRSSGRMGAALATAAVAAGHEVRLLLGPSTLSLPAGITTHRFETGDELARLLERYQADFDDLIMAAAVCDYRPCNPRPGKHRSKRSGMTTLELEATPDLVAQIARGRSPHQRVVAFALEEADDLDARARTKLVSKQVDAIVANPLSTMDAEQIAPVWITREGHRAAPGQMRKEVAAAWILGQLATLREASHDGSQ